MPFSVREGINIFLAGFVPTENMRFRDFELSFKVREGVDDDKKIKKSKEEERKELDELSKMVDFHYPAMTKTLGSFKMTVSAGKFSPCEVVVMLG